LSDLKNEKFSLIAFYERRARRILPALFFVIFTCIPFAYFWLLPNDIKDFSKSLMAVSIFVSNILFWRESTYFNTDVELKPLIHTWSLSVEGQYYILFPLFFLLVWRFGVRWTLVAIAFLIISSLTLAQWAAYAKPAAAFYLLPTRGWELLIGSLTAFYLSKNDTHKFCKFFSEAVGYLALILILFGVFAFSRSMPLPGFYGLVPILGTALFILFTTHQTSIGRLIGNRVFGFIGLTSYSAYLWHQPLFAFAKYAGINTSDLYTFGILFVLIIFLAFFSWHFIETPFRDQKKFRQITIFGVSTLLTILIFSIGFLGYEFSEKLNRFTNNKKYSHLENRLRFNYGLSKDCDRFVTDIETCKTSSQPEILLWGDSFAMHLAHGFLSSNPQVKLIQATVAHCAPVFEIAYLNAMHGSKKCIDSNDFIFELIRRYPSIKYVVLGSPSFHIGREIVTTRDGIRISDQKQIQKYFEITLENIRALGLIPIIFAPPPISMSDVGSCLRRAEMGRFDKSLCDFPLRSAKPSQIYVKEILHRISKDFKVVWLDEAICPKGLCKMSIDGVLLYTDDGHFSYEGSGYIGNKINFYKVVTESDLIKR
jgi:peptidoglycan/LPS O-acetylase OafA/YrhL